MMEWTNELIFEFLTLYENEPALWNSSSPQHKNKNDVHDGWLRIKANLSDGAIPITELKKKKENLMSTYRKMKTKIKDSMKTGSGTDNIYKPEWPFYDIMAKFLDGVYKPRKTKTTIMISDESDDDIKEDCNESTQNLESREEQDTAFKTPTIIPKKKSKLNETQNRMDEAYNYLKQLSQMPKKDVSSLYCDLLAEKLRGLQEYTRELAMLEIDNLVFNLKRREREQFHQPDYHTGATTIRHLQPLNQSPCRSPQDSPSSSSYRSQNYLLIQSLPHTSLQAPHTQTFLNPQHLPNTQFPQDSQSFPTQFHPQRSSASQSPAYQSPNYLQSSPHTSPQAPHTQTFLNPQHSPSTQSPQDSPSFPTQFHPQRSSASQSPAYQSPNYLQSSPHTSPQAPHTQTFLNPQHSPSTQSPQDSPSFPTQFHPQRSSASQSPAYQSPNYLQSSPHTSSQAPHAQTFLNPQHSPSTNQAADTPSLKHFYESQNESLCLN